MHRNKLTKKKIIFFSHELEEKTGATCSLLDIYETCKLEKKIHKFNFQKNPLVANIKAVYVAIKCSYADKNTILHLNTSCFMYVALILHILNKTYTLHVHETPSFINHLGTKLFALRFISSNVLFVDISWKALLRSVNVISGTISEKVWCNTNFNLCHPYTSFGLIGTIDRNKRPLLALKYFNSISLDDPNLSLTFFGKVTQSDVFLELIEHSIHNVHFENHVSIEKLHGSYRILLCCSEYESFGMAAAEAILLNKPVILFDRYSFSNLGALLDYPNVFFGFTKKSVDNAFAYCQSKNRDTIKEKIREHRCIYFNQLRAFYEKNFNCFNAF